MAKFCENCGAKLKPGSRFCPECGAKIDADEASTVTVSESEPAKENNGWKKDGSFVREETAVKKKSKIGSILKKALLIYLVLCIATAAYMGFIDPGWFRKDKKDGQDTSYVPSDTSSGQTSSGSGLVDTGVLSPDPDNVTLTVSDCLVDGGGEYFVDPYNIMEDKDEGIKVYTYDIYSEQIPGNVNGFMEIRIPYDESAFDPGEDPRECLGVYVLDDEGNREPELFDVDVENKEVIIYAEHLSKRELYHYRNAHKAERYEVNFGNTLAGNLSFNECASVITNFFNDYGEMSDAEKDYYANEAAMSLILKSAMGGRLKIFPPGLNNYINDASTWITNATTMLALGGEYEQAWLSSGIGSLSKLGLYTSLCKFSYAFSDASNPWNVGGPSREEVLNLYKTGLSTGLDYISATYGTGSIAASCAMYMSGVFVFGLLIDSMFEEAMYQKMYEMGEIYEYFGDTFTEGKYRPRTNMEWYNLFMDIVERYTAGGKQDYIEEAINREIYLYATKFWSLDQETADSVTDAAGYKRRVWPTKAEQEKLTETYVENLKYRLHPIVLQCEKTILKRCELKVLEWYKKTYNKLNYKVPLELKDGTKEKKFSNYYYRFAGLAKDADLSIFQGQLNKDGVFDTKFCMNDWMRAGAPIYVSLYETEEDMLEEKNAVSTAQMIPAKKANDVTVVTFQEQEEDRFTVKTTLYGVTLNLTVEGAILYGEMPSKEILLCQAKPGSKIKVKVEIAGGLPVGLLDWETVNFTWLQSGQTFEF
ncbi:MAG: zinc ribbon domain-containing protein, partial [Erysipelotrichaceae bacterium]|nr:zinc ribbon domain-containing protein [Erysipelotrichaceae bacterium]